MFESFDITSLPQQIVLWGMLTPFITWVLHHPRFLSFLTITNFPEKFRSFIPVLVAEFYSIGIFIYLSVINTQPNLLYYVALGLALGTGQEGVANHLKGFKTWEKIKFILGIVSDLSEQAEGEKK